MEQANIRSYRPEAVIAEKFEAIVALGLANGRMKDFYDLWAVPQTQSLGSEALEAAIAATFERRGTVIPFECPIGLSATLAHDAQAQRRWLAYPMSVPAPWSQEYCKRFQLHDRQSRPGQHGAPAKGG